MTRTDLQTLSATRLHEAKLLLAANASDGAYYLAGYAVECALKACIAKATERHDFPDKKRANESYVRDVRKLIVVAGLTSPLAESLKESEFALRWETVIQWNEESRYSSHSPQEAFDLIEAVENLEYGILPWLKKHY